MKNRIILTTINLDSSTSSEEHKDDIQPSKKPKITIIPPKQLFIDLTNEDTITSSPKLHESSPSAPNVPSKTPSTKDTSSSSIDYTPKSPTLSSSLSTNGYLNPPLSHPPRVPPPPPTQAPNSMEITLSLSPITPLIHLDAAASELDLKKTVEELEIYVSNINGTRLVDDPNGHHLI
ncbi:hypothetical protein Tco_0564231 [Tanacetum coccineum]